VHFAASPPLAFSKCFTYHATRFVRVLSEDDQIALANQVRQNDPTPVAFFRCSKAGVIRSRRSKDADLPAKPPGT